MKDARWCAACLEPSIEAMSPLILLPLTLLLDPPAPPPDRFSHLRAEDELAQAVIDDGLRASPTVRRLASALDASHVIVYVRSRPGLTHRASTAFIAHTDIVTYLLIRIDSHLIPPDRIAMLAHELTHALEVARAHPPVRSEIDLERLYGAIGFPGGPARTFESTEALLNERQARRDLGRPASPSAQKPESRQDW